MRRFALIGTLVLVMGLFAVGASATVLYQDNFDSDVFGYNGESEGWGSSDFGHAFWWPNHGVLESGVSDAIHEKFLWLTGDPEWSDVSVTTRVSTPQGAGYLGILLRAQDKDNYYEFRFTSGEIADQSPEEAAGIGRAEGVPSYRIMKYSDGEITMLAETMSTSLLTVPGFAFGNMYHLEPFELKFEAKGSILTGYVRVIPGYHKLADLTGLRVSANAREGASEWVPIVRAQDREFESGRVGFSHWEYETFWENIIVESVE